MVWLLVWCSQLAHLRLEKLLVHGGVYNLLNRQAEERLMHVLELIVLVWHGIQPVGCVVDLTCWDLKVEVIDNG